MHPKHTSRYHSPINQCKINIILRYLTISLYAIIPDFICIYFPRITFRDTFLVARGTFLNTNTGFGKFEFDYVLIINLA